MAKTIRTFREKGKYGTQARAIVELNAEDLARLDCLDSRWNKESELVKDPAEQIEKIIRDEVRAASRVVMEEGVAEICAGALERLKAWVRAAREVKRSPLGIWLDEGPPNVSIEMQAEKAVESAKD